MSTRENINLIARTPWIADISFETKFKVKKVILCGV